MNFSSSPSQLLVSAPCTVIKRKASYSLQYNATCNICSHEDAVLQTKECGHYFHTRCIAVWPMVHCPTCATPVSSVSIVNVDMETKPAVRSGKWTKAEEDFVTAILEMHQEVVLPLANGTPIRTLLARLLNCTPMRLSKKFQKNPLGNHTFHVSDEKPEISIKDHARQMHHLSTLQAAFRLSISLRRRYDSSVASIELEELSLAARQFWVNSFISYAIMVGQSVNGIDASELPNSKKRRRSYKKKWQVACPVATGTTGNTKKWPVTTGNDHVELLPALKNPLVLEQSNLWSSLDSISFEGTHFASNGGGRTPTRGSTNMMFKQGSFDDAIFDVFGLDENSNKGSSPFNWSSLLHDEHSSIETAAIHAWDDFELA